MAFWRVRGNGISLIHGQRSQNGVRQKVLHTFKNFEELGAVVGEEAWLSFRLQMEQRHPRVAPDWEGVRQKAALLCEERGGNQPVESQWERQRKFRKALRLAARHLRALRLPEDIVAVGRELVDCLEPGLAVLFRQQGYRPETVRELVCDLVPEAERVDHQVDQARAEFDLSPARGKKRFAEVRRYDPFDPDVVNSEGTCWFGRGRYAEAKGCYEQAREMARLQLPDPDRVYSWGQLEARPYLRATANLGLVHYRLENFTQAVELFQECLRRCPDDGIGAAHYLGSAYRGAGQLELALARYQESLNTVTADNYFDVASVLHGLDRIDEAIGYILRGLAINHWFAEALARKCKAASGDYFGADSREWADSYSADNRKYWPPQALKLLKRVTQEPEVQCLLQQLVDVEAELERHRPGPERSALVHRLFHLKSKLGDPNLAYAVAGLVGLG